MFSHSDRLMGKKDAFHTATELSEAENIQDCSSWHVFVSCYCATMPSPSPLLTHRLFTSSIKACLVQDNHVLLFIVLK